MDRKMIKIRTHNSSQDLSLLNDAYKQWVFRYTFLELEKDLSKYGDITSKCIFSENFETSAKIITRDDGIIAGLDEIQYFLVDADPKFRPSIKGELTLNFYKKDGDRVKANDEIFEISGKVYDILAVERVVLNFLARLSGVATYSKSVCEIVKNEDVLVVPTRKTLWGLLDKKAVIIGGGGTHRLNLSDAILIKDSHLDLIDRDISKALRKVFETDFKGKFVEIEVIDSKEAVEAAEVFNMLLDNHFIDVPCVVMFDNMSAAEISDSLAKIKDNGHFDNVIFEASGGITDANLLEYAKSGVDIVSMGCLTGGGVPGLDLCLKVQSQKC